MSSVPPSIATFFAWLAPSRGEGVPDVLSWSTILNCIRLQSMNGSKWPLSLSNIYSPLPRCRNWHTIPMNSTKFIFRGAAVGRKIGIAVASSSVATLACSCSMGSSQMHGHCATPTQSSWLRLVWIMICDPEWKKCVPHTHDCRCLLVMESKKKFTSNSKVCGDNNQ